MEVVTFRCIQADPHRSPRLFLQLPVEPRRINCPFRSHDELGSDTPVDMPSMSVHRPPVRSIESPPTEHVGQGCTAAAPQRKGCGGTHSVTATVRLRLSASDVHRPVSTPAIMTSTCGLEVLVSVSQYVSKTAVPFTKLSQTIDRGVLCETQIDRGNV